MLVMNRKRFISIVGGKIILVGATSYLLSDKSNLVRADLKPKDDKNKTLKPDEKEILFLASLAPSGHNTQPWFVQYLEPYHWIIGNDQSKWLPAIDPIQRETILSIGAFMQNLEYAAGSFGYVCDGNLLAKTNQDKQVMEVKLIKEASKKEVSESAGWILITSKDNSVATLLETGRRMQRLFLKVREKNIAIHPMT